MNDPLKKGGSLNISALKFIISAVWGDISAKKSLYLR